jgi:hypothetical protein
MEDIDTLAIKASDLLDKVEGQQFTLGDYANQIVKQYGYRELETFSKKIQDNCGVYRSPSTLRVYAYVYSQTEKLGIPRDLMFSTCQQIVFSDDPQKYIDMAKEGSSRAEIRYEIQKDKNQKD